MSTVCPISGTLSTDKGLSLIVATDRLDCKGTVPSLSLQSYKGSVPNVMNSADVVRHFVAPCDRLGAPGSDFSAKRAVRSKEKLSQKLSLSPFSVGMAHAIRVLAA